MSHNDAGLATVRVDLEAGIRNIHARSVEAVRLEYRDLGGDYFDRLHPETFKHKLVKRLEALGLKVTVEPMAQTAQVYFRRNNSISPRQHRKPQYSIAQI